MFDNIDTLELVGVSGIVRLAPSCSCEKSLKTNLENLSKVLTRFWRTLTEKYFSPSRTLKKNLRTLKRGKEAFRSREGYESWWCREGSKNWPLSLQIVIIPILEAKQITFDIAIDSCHPCGSRARARLPFWMILRGFLEIKCLFEPINYFDFAIISLILKLSPEWEFS